MTEGNGAGCEWCLRMTGARSAESSAAYIELIKHMPNLIPLALFTAAAAIAFTARSEWERRQLKTEYYTFRKNGGSGTAEDSSKIRLAFLSDLHDYFSMKSPASVLEAIRKERPDIVVLGGDIFTIKPAAGCEPDLSELLDFLADLASDCTVICGCGNHEHKLRDIFPESYAAFQQRLRELGVIFLKDCSAVIDGIAFYGADPEMRFYRRFFPGFGNKEPMPEKYLIGKLGLPGPYPVKVLLLHTPMYLQEAAVWGADLVLSGHFHGGTIRLPGGRGLMTPQYQFFSKECSGEHTCGKSRMIVNRGLGTHTFHIRLNDLPELSIIDIYA